MREIVVLFAHPKFEHSDVNQTLINAVKDLGNVQVRDLYELYRTLSSTSKRSRKHSSNTT